MGTIHSSDRKATNEKFVPGKSYKWEPTDEFALNGEEYSQLLKVLREAAITPGGTSATALVGALSILENLLVAGVEAGIITEMSDAELAAQQSQQTIPLPGQ